MEFISFYFHLNTRSNRRLRSAFDMLSIEEQRASRNLPCVRNC